MQGATTSIRSLLVVLWVGFPDDTDQTFLRSWMSTTATTPNDKLEKKKISQYMSGLNVLVFKSAS